MKQRSILLSDLMQTSEKELATDVVDTHHVRERMFERQFVTEMKM